MIANIVGGVRSMTHEYYKKVLAFRERLKAKDDSYPTKRVYDYMLNHKPKHSYIMMLEEIDAILNGQDLDTWYENNINQAKRRCHST